MCFDGSRWELVCEARHAREILWEPRVAPGARRDQVDQIAPPQAAEAPRTQHPESRRGRREPQRARDPEARRHAHPRHPRSPRGGRAGREETKIKERK